MADIYLQEKKVIIQGAAGDAKDKKEFIICKLPATLGREIIEKYPMPAQGDDDSPFQKMMSLALSKVSDYETKREIMRKMIAYVQVDLGDGRKIALTDDTLINNHISGGEMLMNLENAMLEYNFGFFKKGEISKFLNQIEADDFAKEYQNIDPLIGILISNRMATLQELRTVYTLEDAVDMYEALIIPKFNEYRAAKKATQNKGHR